MKKRLIALLLALTFVFACCTSSFACFFNKQDKEAVALYALVTDANVKIDCYVALAKLTPYNDVEWLLDMIDKTVAPVFAFAEKIGAEIVCDYITVRVDGQTVKVDPLRVINIGDN